MRRDFILDEIALESSGGKLNFLWRHEGFVILRLKIATEAVARYLKIFESSLKFEDFVLSFRS
jgi:hypothetical protein